MNWISFVGLLVVSSSALGRSMYDSYSSRSLHKPKLNMDTPLPTFAYGAGDYGAQSMTGNYGSSYGAAQRLPLFDEPKQKIEAPTLPLTEADIQCKGQVAETVISIGDGKKFIVCLDESKGVEQFCPTGLFYKSETHRCERKFGLSTDPCVSNPCLNNGQCVRTEYSYQCQCAPGFDGRTCELDSRICHTQQPCGQSLDSKCQSFHVGAALQHVCILQDGLFYGLDARQTYASPCTVDNGPHPLAFSNKGFIMCDGDFLFVQSCPGGTIWDDFNKACVWPEMENIVTIQSTDNSFKQSHGQSKYDTLMEKSRVLSHNTKIETPRVSSHWSDVKSLPMKPLLSETTRLSSNLNKIETSRVPSFGVEVEKPRGPSYWNQIETSHVPAFGTELETPRFPTFGAQIEKARVLSYDTKIGTPQFSSNWNQVETSRVPSLGTKLETPRFPSHGGEIETQRFSTFGGEIESPLVASYWSEVQRLPSKPMVIETPRGQSVSGEIETSGVSSSWNKIETPRFPTFGGEVEKQRVSSQWSEGQRLPSKPMLIETPRGQSFSGEIETSGVSSDWNKIETPRFPTFGGEVEKHRVSSQWSEGQRLPSNPMLIEKQNEVIRMKPMLIEKQQDFIPMRQSSGY